MCLYKLLFTLTSPTRCISIWHLDFLISSLGALTIFIHSSHVITLCLLPTPVWFPLPVWVWWGAPCSSTQVTCYCLTSYLLELLDTIKYQSKHASCNCGVFFIPSGQHFIHLEHLETSFPKFEFVKVSGFFFFFSFFSLIRLFWHKEKTLSSVFRLFSGMILLFYYEVLQN